MSIDGPYFEDLQRGDRFDHAPAVTLTSGYSAAHRLILGDRLPIALDSTLSRAVTGRILVDPASVWDLAIGQSTLATRRVIANVFYRGLEFHRFPELGDTLSTSTEVVALRQNSARPQRRASGLAALRVTTTDQEGRLVLDFHRCAMLPLRDPKVATGHRDPLDQVGVRASSAPDPLADWRFESLGDAASPRFVDLRVGQSLTGWADVVSSAPELARLTLNLAEVHHDARAGGGRRLVYGGHTIGLAMSQAARAIPALAAVIRWHGCDHLGPVYEGDTLRSRIDVVALSPAPRGGGVVTLRSRVQADGRHPAADVLDWTFDAFVL